jgi:hypothetical protein
MLIVRQRSAKHEHVDAELTLPFELRLKSRLRTSLQSGEEVGLFLDRGEVLRGGDCLVADDGRRPHHELSLMSRPGGASRAAYHLGTHTPVEIGADCRFPADACCEICSRLGAVTRCALFEPVRGPPPDITPPARQHAGIIHDSHRARAAAMNDAVRSDGFSPGLLPSRAGFAL